ncbi:MAG: glycine cleavage T C-terminal barrel domain-containing protein [Parvularculaceae bacterium]
MIFPGPKETGDPKPTPLYGAVAAVSSANSWTSINGWAAALVCTRIDEEYASLTRSVGVFDASALCRYTVRGADAGTLLSRLTTAPVRNLADGDASRGLLLASDGAVVTMARVARLTGDTYLLTVCEPIARRLQIAARGFAVETEDITGHVAAMALLGPEAHAAARVLGVVGNSGPQVSKGRVRGVEVAALPFALGELTGLELIYPQAEAITLWDRVRRKQAAQPVGLEALDIVRIESASPRVGVDFASADHAGRDDLRRTPDEIGLPHLAPLDRGWYSGRAALARFAGDRQSLSGRYLVPLAIDAEDIGAGSAVLAGERVSGRVTSAAFSPRLRQSVCIAEIDGGDVGKSLAVATPDAAGQPVSAHFLDAAEARDAAKFRAS